MKNKQILKVWRRFLIVAVTLVFILGLIDVLLYRAKIEEEKTQVVFQVLQEHKILTNELYTVFHSVESDSNFFAKNLIRLLKLKPGSIEYKADVKTLVEFLDTHPGYFKVRVTTASGQELLKIVQNKEHTAYHLSNELFDLSKQPYFIDLSRVVKDGYYFTSMEPNIINSVVETPLRPTIRVSKRIDFDSGESGLLVLNIDGGKILDLFSSNIDPHVQTTEKALIDKDGFYVASYPRLHMSKYTTQKSSFKKNSPSLFRLLKEEKSVQGGIMSQGEMLVYSKFLLPNSTESWFLVSKTISSTWETPIYNELLTWVFWELVFLSFFLTWLWKDDKKRHEDEVVGVLLKERSEFIQNVSHQLKTPLAIMLNSLETTNPVSTDWNDLKKEITHLSKVVEDMLLLAQVDSIQNLPLKLGDLLEIVSAAVDATGPKAKHKGISIRFNVEEIIVSDNAPLEMLMMGDLLQSAIVNIIDNGIDFSPVGGVVDVLVTKEESRFVLRISDNGPGIPPEFLDKMFLRFSRWEGGPRRGSGLGLAISKKIVELHNGIIRLTRYRGGATFEIKL